MRGLIYRVAKAICHFLEKPKPDVDPLHISSWKIKSELDAMRLNIWRGYTLDHFQDYYYVSAKDWAEVFSYIYFEFDMPSYIESRMDCDDFAILLKALVSYQFKLNCFGFVLGNTPMGYHAWNIFKTDNGWLQLEPQTGKFFELGEHGYEPEYIII